MRKLLTFILMVFLISACSTKGKNLIVRENKLPGTTDWLIDVAFDSCDLPDHRHCRRPQIEGYCSHTSISRGDTIDFHISTKPASGFMIDIYRMGYYQGKGGTLKMTIGPLQGTEQPDPVIDSLDNFFECEWDIKHRLVIPDNWLSGVYLCKMTTVPDEYQAYMIFIVKDDRKADFIFQCSDLTWQSYNKWPEWHSLYDERNLPIMPRCSFNRPYTIFVNGLPMRRIGRRYGFEGLTNGSGEFLLWEFPLSYWMEQKGFDMTYISNLDVHANSEELLRSKAFLSVGHDEYWTIEMADNVCKARDSGVNILFIGGNSISGTVFLNPATDKTPYRTVDNFRTMGKVPRIPEGRRVNAREIMGVASHGVGFGSFVCREPSHWFFAGTGMLRGDSIKDLIGWESNGRPVGNKKDLIILAEAQVRGSSGGLRDTTRNQLTSIYTTDAGSFVFQAGSCYWPLFLTRTPVYREPYHQPWFSDPLVDVSKPDPRVQRMTLNLLRKAISD